jgi:predicted TPR repeat methyltransferase
MTKKFLDKAYEAREPAEARTLYDEWSASYETEMSENGYATPARCAAALAEFAPDTSVPLLDFGCGTGLAGLALREAGFKTVDAVDLSTEMVERARAKDIYRTVTQIEADTPMSGDYTLIAAVGVIGAGAAPLSTLDRLLHALPAGGLLVFSFNDTALENPASIGCLNEWLDCSAARLLFAEHGDHLPARNMGSTVYVVEKA